MNFGLTEITINKIISVFTDHPEIEKAIIYGSRAKGNYRNGSDIDITLYGDTIQYSLLSSLNQEIDALNLPYLFDISLYNELESDDLKEHINRVGQLFYKKNE
jgi:uncharacterized protein